jgi:putative FmdB family regulatory protein
MPVYEYQCTSCGKDFEYEHRMSEKRTVCEACGGELERLISRTSFAFKGGGWYKDLYASAKPGASDGGSKSSGGDGGSSSGSSSGGGGSSSDGGGSSGSSSPAPSSSGSSTSSSSGSGGGSSTAAAS